MEDLHTPKTDGEQESHWGLRRVWELLAALTAAQLKARYRRSLLGFFWSLVTPLFQVVVVAFVFRVLWPHEIHDYWIKYLCGLLPWVYLNDGVLGACPSFLKFRDVVKKVYLPRWALPVSVVASALVHLGLSLIILLAVLPQVRVAFQISYLFVPVLIALLTLIVTGLALLFSVMHTFYQDVEYALTAFLRAFLFLTPVFYPLEVIESEQYRNLILYNPMATICEGFRSVLLPPYLLPQAAHVLATLGFGVVCLVVGIAYYRRHQHELPEVL